MRCPKCHYISFGNAERCRNCGYEFSLAAEPKPIDLPIQKADDPLGLDDLILSDRAPAQSTAPQSLPLFLDRDPLDDAPLVSPSAVPRPPLAVRRGPATIVRGRGDRAAADSAVEAEQNEPHFETRRRVPEPAFKRESELADVTVEDSVASIAARLIAGIVDVLTLASIDAGVLYLTLQAVELPLAQIRELPAVPLVLFLLLLNGGYLTTFTTAGGQTIGKMLTGIKVVMASAEGEGFHHRVTLGSAVLRATAYFVSLLPVGLGFVPILITGDRRALHDRLANTRVVKA